MKSLDQYRKKQTPDKLDSITTGVSIEKRQKIFLEERELNLSALVRDMLDDIMAKDARSKK